MCSIQGSCGWPSAFHARASLAQTAERNPHVDSQCPPSWRVLLWAPSFDARWQGSARDTNTWSQSKGPFAGWIAASRPWAGAGWWSRCSVPSHLARVGPRLGRAVPETAASPKSNGSSSSWSCWIPMPAWALLSSHLMPKPSRSLEWELARDHPCCEGVSTIERLALPALTCRRTAGQCQECMDGWAAGRCKLLSWSWPQFPTAHSSHRSSTAPWIGSPAHASLLCTAVRPPQTWVLRTRGCGMPSIYGISPVCLECEGKEFYCWKCILYITGDWLTCLGHCDSDLLIPDKSGHHSIIQWRIFMEWSCESLCWILGIHKTAESRRTNSINMNTDE